jgi:polysaccharide pyruvyl transferase WcaK-like protein
MKIAVITLHGYFNYGNRLQNYALVKTLQKMGHDVDTLVVKSYIEQPTFLEKISRKRKISDYIRIPRRLLNRFLDSKYNQQINLKKKKLEQFSDKYLNEIFVDQDRLSFLSNQYDYIIAGSDQIWNEKWTKDYYFLNFSPKEKNIAYAASIGNDHISDDYRESLKEKLRNFKSISVRETLAQEMISNLVEERPLCLLDPTLLLDRKEWNVIADQSEILVKGNYLLTYFLDEAPSNEIKFIAKERGINVVNLYNPKNKKYLSASVEDFLKLFSQASMVLTDSFHGTVFSLIYEKKFVVLPRCDMNTRLHSILNLFGLENRFADITVIDEEIDYQIIKKIIKTKQMSSLEFLFNNLN